MRGLGAVRALAVLVALAAAGCASLNEKECRGGDWDAIGRADGARGARADEIERHQKACARHDVPVNEEAWRAGYATGLAAFCTAAEGYVAARSGDQHNDVCFGMPEEEKFLLAFRHGQEVHKLLREISALRQYLRDHEMAVLSGKYDDSEASRMRMRAVEAEGALSRRRWEADQLDRRYSIEHGATPLPAADLR